MRASALALALSCTAMATNAAAQTNPTSPISSESATSFAPVDAGTVGGVRTIGIRLNRAMAISSIAIEPGFSEFNAGAASGCVVDGHTVNAVSTVCEIPVTFQPRHSGILTAPVVVTDGSGVKSSIGLSGVGIAPQAALTPGLVTKVAGGGAVVADGGPATSALLTMPGSVAIDSAGNLYIVDITDFRVRKVNPQGVISTLAGNRMPATLGGKVAAGDGGPATNANVSPFAVAVGVAGEVYFSDNNLFIRKVDVNGTITTVAGNGQFGFSGDNGPATEAQIAISNGGLTVDSVGNLYFSDLVNERIRKIDINGIITTVAGTGVMGHSGDGGPATGATLYFPAGITVDKDENLYVAEFGSSVIRKIDTNGIITTVAGTAQAGFSGDGGPAILAQIGHPLNVAADAAGNIYFGDRDNKRVRRIDTKGMIATVAGDGLVGQVPANGTPATQASISPGEVTLDSSGNLYISSGKLVMKVDVSQSAAAFAAQPVGVSSPLQNIVLTNIGNRELGLGGESSTSNFNLTQGGASDCSSFNHIGIGSSCSVRISFAPTEVGPIDGSASILDNSLIQPTTQPISLNGTGVSQ